MEGYFNKQAEHARAWSASTCPGQLQASNSGRGPLRLSAPQNSKSSQVLICNSMYKIIFKVNERRRQYQTKFVSCSPGNSPHHLIDEYLREKKEYLCVFDCINTGYRPAPKEQRGGKY